MNNQEYSYSDAFLSLIKSADLGMDGRVMYPPILWEYRVCLGGRGVRGWSLPMLETNPSP